MREASVETTGGVDSSDECSLGAGVSVASGSQSVIRGMSQVVRP